MIAAAYEMQVEAVSSASRCPAQPAPGAPWSARPRTRDNFSMSIHTPQASAWGGVSNMSALLGTRQWQ